MHPRGGVAREAGDRARARNRPNAANREAIHGALPAVLSGPSFAKEVARGLPTDVVVASRSIHTARTIQELKHAPNFRTYASATDSFRDHGYFLTVNSRYAPAFAYTNDADQFLYQIWKAGYATSPTYVPNVTGLMKQYNLYQYDKI